MSSAPVNLLTSAAIPAGSGQTSALKDLFLRIEIRNLGRRIQRHDEPISLKLPSKEIYIYV
jgi:hypothetical protein